MDEKPTDAASAVEAFAKAVEHAQSTAVAASTSTDLVLGKDEVAQTKLRLGSAYSEVARATNEANELHARARKEVDRLRDELNQKIWAMEQQMAPMRKLMARLADGISAVNLYLGRDEELRELRAGDSATPGTPLHIRQQVLAMDEETALFAESGGLDFKDIEVFVNWLLASPVHLDQVLPDQLGVVAIMARRTPVNYTDDPTVNARLNETNFESWWLIRNGERLYLMITEFSVGTTLIPARDAFTKMFERRDRDGNTVSLEPGSHEWLAAEEQADGVTRHYMKIALILQGLVARTAVFHPLPEGGLNLLSQADYDSGRVVLIADDELALGTGRPSFADWQKDRLVTLEVGMRVVGHFPRWSDKEPNVRPRDAEGNLNLVPHTIVRMDAQSMAFTFERTDTVWRDGYRESGLAKTRGTYTIDREAWGTVSYISIDNVEVEDMEYYLRSRSERHAYKNLFPALQNAIAFKIAEDEAETGFRTLLATALIAEALTVEPEVDAYIRELITWWKTSNKWHRALNGDPEHERLAQAGILREARRRARAGANINVVSDIGKAVPGAMVIASRTNDIIAVEPEERIYGAGSVPQNLWVRIHEFTPRGKFKAVTGWKLLTRSQIAKWTVHERDARFDGWMLDANPKHHLGDEAITAAISGLLELAQPLGNPVRVRYSEVDRGSSAESPAINVSFESRMAERWQGEAELVQPHVGYRLTVKDGRAVFPSKILPSKVTEESWNVDTGGWGSTQAPTPKSPHLSRSWGIGGPETVVWEDETECVSEVVRGEKWLTQWNENRALASRRRELGTQLERAWVAEELAARKQRFVEDFGDETLWESHSKSQKAVKSPLSARNHPASLIIEAGVAAGLDFGGKTLGEVLAELPGFEAETADISDVTGLSFDAAAAE